MVYVDPAVWLFGRMVMCHMWADTRDELFAMADRIGVARKWFQRPATVDLPGMPASWEHFDISKSKRALAVAAGAKETDRYAPLEHTALKRIQRGDWGGFHQLAAVAEARARK